MSIVVVIAAIILLIGMDQLSKIWAVHVLSQASEIKLWEGVFHLHYLENRGAAWGIFSGKQLFLILLTSVIIIGLIIYLFRLPDTTVGKWYKTAFILIISGAIGNLIDRVFLGYVRDFLYFRLIDFPIFNVADMFVVCGVILLLIIILFVDKESEEKKEEEK